jgi:sugar phosphate isomerase/epimerase
VRLGVGLSVSSDDPDIIARAYNKEGYSAAICPEVRLNQPERIRAIQDAFTRYDVLLAEMGVWNNMLHPDPAIRANMVQQNIDTLAIADEVGVLCCVNIAGSFDTERWDGPHPRNLSDEAYELTAENVRKILDAVKPGRTVFTIETMPWSLPDSIESYQRLLSAVDHPKFGVHLDPVNMINSPHRYYSNSVFLRECFDRLGEKIVSVHAKDLTLTGDLTVYLKEVRPGLGGLDYKTFLREMNKLPMNTPFMLEHLPQEEYSPARNFVLAEAKEIGVSFYQSLLIDQRSD